MSSVQALDLAPEIWLKIGTYFVPDTMYYVGGCCAGPFRPSPGAGAVGPLPSAAPSKDLINLSCACRIMRSVFEDEIKASLSLHVRNEDKRLVHQRGGDFPNIDGEKEDDAEIHDLATLPLGNHIRHLRLALRVSGHHDIDVASLLSRDYGDELASILDQTPRLQTLYVSAKFGYWGNDFDLSPGFCRALSTLKDLHTIKLRGLSIPADCPILRSVEHIQTDAKILSFKCLPRLRDLRQDPQMFALGYDISSYVLARLEVLHYCSPDSIDERALLPKVCRDMKNARSKQPLVLHELVLNGYPDPNELLDILHGLASPNLRTFVCFGLFSGEEANYNEAMQALKKASPNLATLEFPKPVHQH